MHFLLSQLQKPGLRAADLEQIYSANRSDPGFAEALASVCALGDPLPQDRALALLLRRVRRDGAPPPAVIERLLDSVSPQDPGFAPLHLCQLLAALQPGPPESAADFLVAATRHPRPFVRAWACSALYVLSRRHPALRAEIAPLLRRAAHDSAPSVRARLRRVRVEFERARENRPLALASP